MVGDEQVVVQLTQPCKINNPQINFKHLDFMATDLKKLATIQKELTQLKNKLQQYRKIFESDGLIDTDEQKTITAMETLIEKAEEKVKEEGGGQEHTVENQKHLEMQAGLAALKAELESVLLVYGLE